MKNLNWVILILLLFSSSIIAQNIETLKEVRQTSFDFSRRVVYDNDLNIIGNVQGIQDFDKLEGFSDFVFRGKITLTNGKVIEINPLESVIVCEDANRIFTFGPTRIDHWWDGYPNLLIFDLEGNLISNYGIAIDGEYYTHVSKSGDIYFVGTNRNEKLKGVIKKIDKNGKLIWETQLPKGLFSNVRGIQVIDSSEMVVILRSDTGFYHGISQSEIFVLDNKGNTISTSTSRFPLDNLVKLGNDKILCSHNGLYYVGNVGDIKFDNRYYMPDGIKRPLSFRISPNGEKIAIFSKKDGLVKLYELEGEDNFFLEKEIRLIDFKKLRGFHFEDDERIVLVYKNRFSIIR